MTRPKGKFVLRVPDDVAHFLRKLHPVIKSHIRSGLGAILADPSCGKALKDDLAGLRSYRVKRYRIIYRVQRTKKYIDVVAVGPRRVIYEETLRLIHRDMDPEG